MSNQPATRHYSEMALAPAFDGSAMATVPEASIRRPRGGAALMAEIGVTVIPSMVLVGIGRPDLGANLFFLILLVLLARHAFFKRPLAYTGLAMSVLPVQMLLREYFFYNSTLLILFIGLGLWVLVRPDEFTRLWENVRWRGLFLCGATYWALSFYLTGVYSVNLRTLELVFSVAAICLLARQRRFFAATFRGMGLAVVAIGFASLSYGTRHGTGEIADYSLANPITFGIPLALVLLLSIADNGKWLMLDGRPWLRLALVLSTAAFLLLSTSRGSWAVVFCCMIALSFDHKQRSKLALPVILSALLIGALLTTGRGQDVEQFLEKTLSSERTLSQRTSGRSDQWALFPRVFMDSPLIGFGPGSGRFVYGSYSLEYQTGFQAGAWMGWHSLYMQLGVETGIFGLFVLSLFVIPLILDKSMHWRLYGESVPFVGVFGFIVLTFSTSGLDGISGTFLGIGFLGSRPRQLRELFKGFHPGNHRIQGLSKELVTNHLEQFELIDADTNGEPWGSHEWLADLPAKWDLSWVIMRGEDPIAFLVASQKEDALHVHRLAVISHERRKNFGQMLMAAAAWRAQNAGCQKITLKVHQANIGALAFYNRLGFDIARRERENLLLTAESARVFDLS